MPSTTTTNNTQRKSYLSRVLSVNGSASRTEQNNNALNGSFKSGKNLKRANEELRSHVGRLTAEIELEKIKSKQTHRDKVAEVKRIKDHYERANNLSIESVTQKMKNLSELEVKKLRENLTRDKDAEIKQIIKFKDEEIKTLQRTMQEESKRLHRQLQKTSGARGRFNNTQVQHHDNYEQTMSRLKRDVSKLQNEKDNIDEKYSRLLSVFNQKDDMIKQLKVDHERALQKMLREARRENSRSVSELQTMRKSLHERDAEISKLDSFVSKISQEKEHLEDKIRLDKSTLSERSSFSMEQVCYLFCLLNIQSVPLFK